jgi:hypothetical protein
MDLYSANLLKQQSAGRHVAQHRHTMLILNMFMHYHPVMETPKKMKKKLYTAMTHSLI